MKYDYGARHTPSDLCSKFHLEALLLSSTFETALMLGNLPTNNEEKLQCFLLNVTSYLYYK